MSFPMVCGRAALIFVRNSHSTLISGVSKLANILHINELQRRLTAEGYINITCISLHPGAVMTPASVIFFDNMVPYFGWLTGWIARMFALDEVKGSWTPVFAAAGKEVADNKEKYRAAYLTWWRCMEVPAEQARSERLAKELWETTEEVLLELKV